MSIFKMPEMASQICFRVRVQWRNSFKVQIICRPNFDERSQSATAILPLSVSDSDFQSGHINCFVR